MRAWLGVAVSVSVLVLAGCGGSGSSSASGTTTAGSSIPPAQRPESGAPPWVRPSPALKYVRKAGLEFGRHEFLLVHHHSHLDVFVNGQRVGVPGGVGINIKDKGVQRGTAPDGTPEYGGIQECRKPCISVLHTHSDDGILHTESTARKPNLLGQFFTEWNVRLTRTCVGGFCEPRARIRFYVNGKPYRGNPRRIKLLDLRQIAIVIGTPPARIPSRFPQR